MMASRKANGMPRRAKTHGWISIVLKPWTMFGFVFLAAVMIAGIIVLTVLSKQRSGFVAISGDSFFALGSSWELNLLWTALPSLIFRLTVMYWDAIVAGFVDRQPYVELSRSQENGGVPFKKSILLDYRTTFSPFRWFAAFKNAHVLIGLSILLGLIFSTIAAPLASALIVPRVVSRLSTVSIVAATAYDDLALNATTNWKPVFDKVSTVVLYNGEASPWTNDDFAFPAFAIDSGTINSATASNITTTVHGTTAELDCVDVANYQASTASTVDILTRIKLQGSDRGCAFEYGFGTANTTEVHLETFTTECSADVGEYKGRLVFVAGKHDASLQLPLSNISVISCIARYRTAEGQLTFSTASNVTGIGFRSTTGMTESGNPRASVIESNLFLSTDFSLNAPWSTSHFGSIVLYLAMQKTASAYLGVDTLMQSIQTVFKSTFITASAMYSFPRTSDRASVAATLSEAQTRLFVIEWVAGTSIAMLALCLLLAVLIWFAVQRHGTMLDEEPQGSLSAAGILHGSDIFARLIDSRCNQNLNEGKLVKGTSATYDIAKSTCILRQKEGHRHLVIDVKRLVPRDELREAQV